MRTTASGARAGVAFALAISAFAGAAAPDTRSPALRVETEPALGVRELALVVNDADPQSVAVGAYYASVRAIAPDHVLHVRLAPAQAEIGVEDFSRVRADLDAHLPPSVQVLALAWTLPYRVGCMSVTSAFALGYDPAYCAEGCRPTRPSPYFNSPSRMPWTDHRIRPAMLLAGRSVDDVKRLIDRGKRAEDRWPDGTAYLVSTSDRKRNVRAETYAATERLLGSALPVRTVHADALEHRTDVLFYFTGTALVRSMETNRYVDVAAADHLTSFGGVLDGTSQTTVLAWLAAGATGSYGTVVEPCAFRAKFPDVPVVIGHYLAGETLVEAYWKSVLMPGQGVFVGDPLARPFGSPRIRTVDGEPRLQVRALAPGNYLLQVAHAHVGPYRTVAPWVQARFGLADVPIPREALGFVRLVPASH